MEAGLSGVSKIWSRGGGTLAKGGSFTKLPKNDFPPLTGILAAMNFKWLSIKVSHSTGLSFVDLARVLLKSQVTRPLLKTSKKYKLCFPSLDAAPELFWELFPSVRQHSDVHQGRWKLAHARKDLNIETLVALPLHCPVVGYSIPIIPQGHQHD